MNRDDVSWKFIILLEISKTLDFKYFREVSEIRYWRFIFTTIQTSQVLTDINIIFRVKISVNGW